MAPIGARAQVLIASLHHVLKILHRPPDLRGGDLGVLRARGSRRDALAADRPVSGDRAAGRHRAGRLSRRLRRSAGADRRRAARKRDQRRAGHDLHELALDGAGRHADRGHVRDRHQRRRRDDQRQQPREAGRAAAAARSAAAGRVGRARLLVVPAGAGVLLAGRPLQRPLHVELRDAQRPRRAEAPAGHDERADLRRQGLRDAHLAPARPHGAAQADARPTSPPRSTSRTRSSRPARSGQTPIGGKQDLVYTITTRGRLADPKEFGQIIVRANPDGSTVRLSDVARVELGSKDYDFIGRYNGHEATLVGIFLSPGANALSVAKTVQNRMAEPRAEVSRRASPTRSPTTPRASSRCRSPRS